MSNIQFLTGDFDVSGNGGSQTQSHSTNFPQPVDSVYAVMSSWKLKYTGSSAHNIKTMESSISAEVNDAPSQSVTITFTYNLQSSDDSNKSEGTVSYLLIGVSG